MKPPRWTRGGAFAPTAAGTAISLVAVPIGGLGVLAAAFRAFLPAVAMLSIAAIMWATGRWLLSR